MERIRSLDRYQKGILLILAVMILVFSVIYPVTTARKGFAYKGAILVPVQENGNTVYSGKIEGERACFTVYADKTVEFQYGDEAYGPYTAREDPTAISEELAAEFDGGVHLTGIELRKGEEIFFRGSVMDVTGRGDYRRIFNENGSLEIESLGIDISASPDAILLDERGNVIDQMEPSASAILNLMAGPELVHKGEWGAWFGGVCVCIFTVVSILFADELFRWDLSFRIRNAKQAEPSEWEMTSRYLGWALMAVVALILFVSGLR